MAMEKGRLERPPRAGSADPFRTVPGLPHGARVALRVDSGGRCVFLDPERGRLCTIHSHLGPGALASACRDFPRVVTLTPDGFSITLSHYCPTAAGRLFRDRPRPTVAIACSDHGTCYGEGGRVGHRVAHPVVWTVPYAEAVW